MKEKVKNLNYCQYLMMIKVFPIAGVKYNFILAKN